MGGRAVARPGAEVISDEVDGTVVAINLLSGRYFSLSRGASALWALLQQSDGIRLAEGEDPRIVDFLDALVAEQLARVVEAGSMPVSVLPPDIDLDDLTFTAHSDLQDLLALDPIHDVDPSAGWPQQA